MNDQQHPIAIPVAVVGMSAIYPGEPGLEGYWRTVVGGRDAISEVPPSHWLIEDYFDPDPNAPDKTYCKRGGFIDSVPFDPLYFGLPPTALPATDSAQLLALIAAKQVLDKATRNGRVDLDRVDVVLGVASTTELVVQMGARLQRPIWRKALLENGLPEHEADEICRDIADHYAPWQEATFPGLLGNVVAGRIANRLNLGGSNYVTDAACASSLSALQVALHRLYLHEADLVLTGGVDALNDVMMYMCFSKTPAFSPTGDCRPFSDAADGTIIGEGVGMLALKRLSDAEREGDSIHAVIRGLGSSSDGRASSVYAPRAEGQAKALRRAYDRAGYAPSTVELLEAHGTATKAGDIAEFAALKSVFTGVDSTRCAIGSVKSQIGHTKAAAGAAGIIKAVLALQHSTLPATLKVHRPNPALGLADTPFYINSQTRPWVRTTDSPRRAAVSSFGFGGSNFHVTLEEYRGPRRAKRLRALASELVVLSATCEADLAKRCAKIIAAVQNGESLARIAFDSAREFDASHAARAGLVALDAKSLATQIDRLRTALAHGAVANLNDADIAVGLDPPRAGKTAFLFPGQGSQYVGMGADLALAFPEALAVWDALDGDLADLPRIVFPEPAFDPSAKDAQLAELTAMVNAQPAIATVSLAQLTLLDILGVTPHAAAGHSFGEVTALTAAGIVGRDRLVETARTRGFLMTEAGNGQSGAMLAVAASAENVRALLNAQPQLAQSLVVANDNAPCQVALAGLASDIARAEDATKSAGWTSFRLPVASAFHSPVVAAGSAPFAAHLKTMELAQPHFPVYSNATAQPYGLDVADQLADQLQQPVRFREMVEAMARDGVTRFIEVGPSRVLTGLVSQILDAPTHLAVALDDRKAGELRGWHRGLATLAADGVALDLVALFDSYDIPEKHAAVPSHAVLVGGANLGKPYPPADGKASITPKRGRVQVQATPLLASEVPAPALIPQGVGVRTPAAEPLSSVDTWSVIDSIQRETVQQHQRFLDVMTQGHQAFLDMSAQMLAEITGNHPTVPQAPRSAPEEFRPAPDVAAYLPSPQPAATTTPRPTPEPEPVAVAALAPSQSADDIVLATVSEKTGYPVDMLRLDMEMEAELGIDSIKQVEILSALQARFPGTPEIAASELAGLRTLQDVVDSVAGLTSADHNEHVPSQSADDIVLATVSEKTGYPVDMLRLDMEMEAELGIDSIKQVEILSALQARFPGTPEIAASELAGLRTLQDVVDSVAGLTSNGNAEHSATADLSGPLRSATAGLSCTRAALRLAPAIGFAMAGLGDGEVLITREAPDFADALERTMLARGLKARAVDEVPDDAAAVICLAALAVARSPQDCVDMHLRAFRAARSVAMSDAPSRLFVTVQSTGADFTPDDVPVGVASIVKTAAWEWPNASVRAIDMESLDAERLTDELLAGGSGVEVALRDDGARLVVGDAHAVPEGEEAMIGPGGGVVVVTGGARGVTAASALALAARHGLRLALLGRTSLGDAPSQVAPGATVAETATALVASSRARAETMELPQARALATRLIAEQEVRETLSAAQRQGIVASYLTADTTDPVRLRSVLDEVRQTLGPIVGLIHGAGVLVDKLLEDLDDDQFVRVFSTKVVGAEVLLNATSADDLRFISLFSSVAARAGNAGQGAYAAANAALEAIASREAARRGSACVVRAFGWGPWDGGMVDTTLKTRFLRAGVGVIAVPEGAEFFAEHALRPASAAAIGVAAPAARRLCSTRMVWDVSTANSPMLVDHQIGGRVVVPVVVVLDAMLRAARGLLGDECFVVCDFQVLAGVTFAASEHQCLTMEFEPTGPSYAVTVRDGEGRQRYRATLPTNSGAPPNRLVPDLATSAWPMTRDDAYAGPLFHGPRFAAIEHLDAFDAGGGSGRLKGLNDLGWTQSRWAIDPAIVDGGLQLGLLWARAHGRSLMLPQRIGRVALHRPFPGNALTHCRFAAHPVSDKRIDFDFVFETANGEPVAALEDVEFYLAGAAADVAQ